MKIRQYNLGNYIVPKEIENGICLEIGANVGSFTEKYKNYFSKIHYYEPLKECFNLIQDKIKEPHIIGFNLAGYKKSNETLDMVLHENKDSGSSGLKTDILNNDWSEKPYQKIKTISLEDMIKSFDEKQIDYCKSDCENGEYYIFMNKDLSKINYLAMELHNQMGSDRWYELFGFICRTHDLISGDPKWIHGYNKDLLFKRKAL